MGVKLNTASGGSVSIEPTNTASNYTITVPASTSTMLTTTSSLAGLTGVGKVLQVVQGTYATQGVTTSSSFVDTGLTASITPSSSSNKVLVLVNLNGCLTLNSSTTAMLVDLVRSSTSICKFGEAGLGNGGRNDFGDFSVVYLDSPATTSSTTYKVQAKSSGGANVYWCNQTNNAVSTITLLEIAA